MVLLFFFYNAELLASSYLILECFVVGAFIVRMPLCFVLVIDFQVTD